MFTSSINISATSEYTVKCGIQIKISLAPPKLYFYDYGSRYTGYYGEHNYVYITGKNRSGSPFIMIGGFPAAAAGTYFTVQATEGFPSGTWRVDHKCYGDPLYALDGTYLGYCTYGASLREGGISNGTYTVKMTTGSGAVTTWIVVKTGG